MLKRLSRRAVLGGLSAAALSPTMRVAVAANGPSLASNINDIGARVLAATATAPGVGNVAIAPHGLHSALTLLAAGASEQTKSAFEASPLLAPMGLAAALADHQNLSKALAATNGAQISLKTASSLWLRPNAQPTAAFQKAADEVFAAKTTQVDFASAETATLINAWVAGATDDKIKTITDRLDERTEFLIASAMYFRGLWTTPFDPAKTADAPFTLRDGSEKSVPTMNGTLRGGYWETDQIQAALIPFGSFDEAKVCMIICQSRDPKQPVQAATPLATLTAGATFLPARLTLALPKFKARFNGDVTDALAGAGLAVLRDTSASFPGLTGNDSRSPTVRHAVEFEVDETGAEGAAATTITGTRAALLSVTLAVDRPFAFAITSRPDALDLIQGVVNDPTA